MERRGGSRGDTGTESSNENKRRAARAGCRGGVWHEIGGCERERKFPSASLQTKTAPTTPSREERRSSRVLSALNLYVQSTSNQGGPQQNYNTLKRRAENIHKPRNIL